MQYVKDSHKQTADFYTFETAEKVYEMSKVFRFL